MKIYKKADLCISIVLMLVIAVMFYQTSLLRDSVVEYELGSRFVPYAVLILMTIFDLALFLSAFRKKPGEPDVYTDEQVAKHTEEAAQEQSDIKLAMPFFLLILLGLVLIYVIGFTPASILCVLLCLRLTGMKLLSALIFSVAATAVIVVIFQFLLSVPLPGGIILNLL